MPSGKKQHAPLAPSSGYSHAAKTAVQETTLRVKEMHRAIAGKSFDILRRIPLISGPTHLVRSAHDVILAGVYAGIHHTSGGVLEAAALIERHATRRRPDPPVPGRLASGLRSAVNGAFGDHLATSNNRLAIGMAIHENGAAVPLNADSLRSAFPDAGRRLCIFIHGLGCDEHSWDPGLEAAESAVHFGRRLRAEHGCSPLYLRYNSGLPIARNGAQLAVLLEELLAAWPQPASDLVIVGHSMGGLVALAACEQAAQAGMRWLRPTRMLICLGSPHLGSPVERLGRLTTAALNLSTITAPLARIAGARSQGIKDLGNGPGAPADLLTHRHIAFRFLGASLAKNVEHPLGEFFGDGLVTLGSATAHAIAGDVQSTRLGQLGHMGLLNDARVYRQIAEWIAALNARATSEAG